MTDGKKRVKSTFIESQPMVSSTPQHQRDEPSSAQLISDTSYKEEGNRSNSTTYQSFLQDNSVFSPSFIKREQKSMKRYLPRRFTYRRKGSHYVQPRTTLVELKKYLQFPPVRLHVPPRRSTSNYFNNKLVSYSNINYRNGSSYNNRLSSNYIFNSSNTLKDPNIFLIHRPNNSESNSTLSNLNRNKSPFIKTTPVSTKYITKESTKRNTINQTNSIGKSVLLKSSHSLTRILPNYTISNNTFVGNKSLISTKVNRHAQIPHSNVYGFQYSPLQLKTDLDSKYQFPKSYEHFRNKTGKFSNNYTDSNHFSTERLKRMCGYLIYPMNVRKRKRRNITGFSQLSRNHFRHINGIPYYQARNSWRETNCEETKGSLDMLKIKNEATTNRRNKLQNKRAAEIGGDHSLIFTDKHRTLSYFGSETNEVYDVLDNRNSSPYLTAEDNVDESLESNGILEEEIHESSVSSVLEIGPLSRELNGKIFSCWADNSKLTAAKTRQVTVNMIRKYYAKSQFTLQRHTFQHTAKVVRTLYQLVSSID